MLLILIPDRRHICGRIVNKEQNGSKTVQIAFSTETRSRKPLWHKVFQSSGSKAPTLKVTGSNPAGRTTNPAICKGLRGISVLVIRCWLDRSEELASFLVYF